MDAKPVKLFGCDFKSRLEARWAVFFENYSGVKDWTYEPPKFSIRTEEYRYTPDFSITLVDGRVFVCEVKPCNVTKDTFYHLKQKVARDIKPQFLLLIGSFFDKDILVHYLCPQSQPYTFTFAEFFTQSQKAFQAADSHRFDIPARRKKRWVRRRRRR